MNKPYKYVYEKYKLMKQANPRRLLIDTYSTNPASQINNNQISILNK